MRYIGSKLKLIGFIKEVVAKYCGEDISDKVFCDLFAGTGIVGRSFSPIVKKVIANDLEYYSYIANKVGLEGYDEKTVKNVVNKLNEINGNPLLPFAQAYADGGSCGRMFYTAENGAKIASAREFLSLIEDMLDGRDFRAALLSIIDGSDAVANTTSVYGAFLKAFKPSALCPVQFKMPLVSERVSADNDVYQENANDLIKRISGDILYLDPPYNTRQYSSNYHILNYVAKNIAPETNSIAGVSEHNKSKYSSKANAADELDDLIKNAKFEWIFLSYNNEGTISTEEIKKIFSKYGEYHVECKEHQRFKADSKRRNLLGSDTTIEYIHVLHKHEDFSQNGPKKAILAEFKLVVLPEVYDLLTAQNSVQKCEKTAENTVQKIEKTAENAPQLYVKKSFHSKLKPYKENREDSKHFIVSPMNYMGGKKRLVEKIVSRFPSNINTFVDLFCGGATVGINTPSNKVIFNDNLPYLTNMYKYFSENDADTIVEYIENTIKENNLDTQNVEAYNLFKTSYNEQLFKNPLDLFILIAFGFNNQVRFNSKGEFNIPFGKNRSGWNPRMKENLINFVKKLNEINVEFCEKDFINFDYSTLSKDDFVYVDPPYLISQATYNSGWDESVEIKLLNILSELNEKGIRFALSNVLENGGKYNDILKKWTEEHKFKVFHFDISYANSAYCRKNKDTVTDEVLITNYEA